jgi:DedD protein
LAGHPHDDGFHEIQLNGKQLVFLFMAATVVSVVIFLTGVLYGRGVRTELGRVADVAAPSVAEVTPQPAPQTPAPPPAGADPTKAAPPPPVDDLSYFNRLEKSNPPDEPLKPQAKRDVEPRTKERPVAPAKEQPPKESPARAAAKEPPAPPPPPPVKEQPAREAAVKEPPPAPANASGSAHAEPSGQGFALQVAALRERREAESIADRLSSKGYGAYVMAPANGTPAVFRVRIGKFKTRREAEVVASKLQKEEQVNPWITH